jgi:hypothetical protein
MTQKHNESMSLGFRLPEHRETHVALQASFGLIKILHSLSSNSLDFSLFSMFEREDDGKIYLFFKKKKSIVEVIG